MKRSNSILGKINKQKTNVSSTNSLGHSVEALSCQEDLYAVRKSKPHEEASTDSPS